MTTPNQIAGGLISEHADASAVGREKLHPDPGVAAHSETPAPVGTPTQNSTSVTGWLSKSRQWRFVPWSAPTQRRWFSFDPRTLELSYFLSDKHPVPHKVLVIQSCEVAIVGEGSSMSFGFLLRTRNSPHLLLFAASEDERIFWVRAIQDALAPKQPLPRSCHAPRPMPSPSCIPEDSAPAPKPSPQRLSASTRYNAALNYQLTQGGRATYSASEFIPENYSVLVQDERCEHGPIGDAVRRAERERHVSSGPPMKLHIPQSPRQRVLHIPQSPSFVPEECVGINPSTKEFVIVEAAHADSKVAGSVSNVKDDGDGICADHAKKDDPAAKNTMSQQILWAFRMILPGVKPPDNSSRPLHALAQQPRLKSPLPGDVPLPRTPPQLVRTRTHTLSPPSNSTVLTVPPESPADSEEDSSENLVVRRSARPKALRKEAPVPQHDAKPLEQIGRDASETSHSLGTVSPVSIHTKGGAASGSFGSASTQEASARCGSGGKKPAQRLLFPEDPRNVRVNQPKSCETEGMDDGLTRLNCQGEVAQEVKGTISKVAPQGSEQALSGKSDCCPHSQVLSIGDGDMSGRITATASNKKKHVVRYASKFDLRRWWGTGRKDAKGEDAKIAAQIDVMSSSTDSTILERQPEHSRRNEFVSTSDVNKRSEASRGEASSASSEGEFAAMSSFDAKSVQEVISSLKVAMDLKSQKSPRSNRSTPFASPKVQPRPRNTPASPISTPRTPSAACVHPNQSQREGSFFEMDVSDSTPVQLTTQPLKRTSTAVATSLVPKNGSGHSARCWVAGNAPISYSRSIRSSLMDSPTNSPSGPDAPDVPSACLEHENPGAGDLLDERNVADRKSDLCYSKDGTSLLALALGRSQVQGCARASVGNAFLKLIYIFAVLALAIGLLERMRPFETAPASVNLQDEAVPGVGHLPQTAGPESKGGSSNSRHDEGDFKPDVLQKLIFSLMASPSSTESEEIASEWTASSYVPAPALLDRKMSAGSNQIGEMVGDESSYQAGVMDYFDPMLKALCEKVRAWPQPWAKDWQVSIRDGSSLGIGLNMKDTLYGFVLGVIFMLAVHLAVDRPAGRRGPGTLII